MSDTDVICLFLFLYFQADALQQEIDFMQDEKKKADEQHQKQIAEQENKMREMKEQQVFFTHFFSLVNIPFIFIFISFASDITQSKKLGVSECRNPKLASTVQGSVYQRL